MTLSRWPLTFTACLFAGASGARVQSLLAGQRSLALLGPGDLTSSQFRRLGLPPARELERLSGRPDDSPLGMLASLRKVASLLQQAYSESDRPIFVVDDDGETHDMLSIPATATFNVTRRARNNLLPQVAEALVGARDLVEPRLWRGSPGREEVLPHESALRAAYTSIREVLTCKISQDLLYEPALTPDGHTYSEDQLRQWLEIRSVEPVSRKPLVPSQLIKNRLAQKLVAAVATGDDEARWRHEKRAELLASLRTRQENAGWLNEQMRSNRSHMAHPGEGIHILVHVHLDWYMLRLFGTLLLNLLVAMFLLWKFTRTG